MKKVTFEVGLGDFETVDLSVTVPSDATEEEIKERVNSLFHEFIEEHCSYEIKSVEPEHICPYTKKALDEEGHCPFCKPMETENALDIVEVEFPTRNGGYIPNGRKYNYLSEIPLSVGVEVVAPTAFGERKARVTKVGIAPSELNMELSRLRTIEELY